MTETKFGVSGARRLMVSQRLRSISSVFGGKNSKEIFGALGARGAFGTEEMVSVMIRKGSATGGQTSGLDMKAPR
ncbi:hypothetical protein [Bradyrhizobium sp. USDA 4508]